ncbi:MAG: peptidase in kexin sedolisin, partial [Rhizobacter sp.]|nr:peptidase in kexin sedolisin [Rhizobacter sp.]
DGAHPHFEKHRNLRDLPPGINHCDLVSPDKPEPLVDRFGHGTHVAGIIAGAYNDSQDSPNPVGAARQIVFERNQSDDEVARELPLARASGVAPECSLVSFKVLGDQGQGPTTGVIAALEEIYRANGYGKATRIHGVNLSVGYPFEPRWFACGHSPLCEVVDRLVRSGVVVVIAAGNNGYALTDLGSAGVWGQGRGMSITDPGNAELAITVGSTHREAPHTYGVSYFSSKGPTGDGRSKPDLLAPGENIVSCASGSVAGRTPGAPLYKEDSGTSMAAPHVSGAIAAFLSVRREFVGKAEAVKTLFLDSALDLKRHRDMQGHGLLDLLRALQSV